MIDALLVAAYVFMMLLTGRVIVLLWPRFDDDESQKGVVEEIGAVTLFALMLLWPLVLAVLVFITVIAIPVWIVTGSWRWNEIRSDFKRWGD